MRSKRAGALAIGGRVAAALAVILVASSFGDSVTPAAVPNPVPAKTADRISFPDSSLPTLALADGRTRQVRSVLNLRGRMDHGAFVWNDAGVPAGDVWVRVDLGAQTVSIFRAGHEIGTAVILYGADEKPTPPGRFVVLAKRADHRSSLYDAPMPFTLRLTNDGIAIHGSDVEGGAATHGCVGVPLAFARRLFEQVKLGDEVQIV